VTRLERQPLYFSDVYWKVIPDYKNKANADGTYGGYVYITVGGFPGEMLNEWIKDGVYDYEKLPSTIRQSGTSDYVGGVTVLVPLDTIYTVKDINGIKLINEPDKWNEYFFWEPNTSSAWANRLAGASIQVFYTGGADKTKTFKIKDLLKKEKIWYNANVNYDDWQTITYDTADAGDIDFDFWIEPVRYRFDKTYPDPGIKIYYRGALVPYSVKVYTKLTALTVGAADGGAEIHYTPGTGRDNDVDNGPDGPAALAKKLKVTATYTAYNDANPPTKDVELTYWFSATDLLDARPTGWYGPYYLFGADVDDFTDDDPEEAEGAKNTYSKSYDKWVKNNLKGVSTTQNITVKHWMVPNDIVAYYETVFGNSDETLPNGKTYDQVTAVGPKPAITSAASAFGVKGQKKTAKQSIIWDAIKF